MRFASGDGHSRILILLWICFLLRGVFYSVLFPLWEGYDEYAHFAFIQHLVAHGSLPDTSTKVSKEVEESLKLVPLPWTLRDLEPPHVTHDDYWRLPEEERSKRQGLLTALPRDWARRPATGVERYLMNWEAQQPPLYYGLLTLPLRLVWNASLPCRVLLLRLLSVCVASLVIPVGFQIARRIFGGPELALGTCAIIAAMPELMVNISRVGNESLAILFYSLLMYAVLRFLENPDRPGIVALLATSLGLGLLTKAYFMTSLPAIATIFVCRSATDPAIRRRVVNNGLPAFALALFISGWWYARNHAVTGSWSGVMQEVVLRRMPLWELLKEIRRVDWRNALDTILFSHIWLGNWSFLLVRSWIYHAFEYVALPALVGLAILFFLPRLLEKQYFRCSVSPNRLIVPAAFYGFFWFGLFYHTLITFVAQGVSASQGYYLYGLVVAEVVMMVSGLLVLCPTLLRPWIVSAATIGFSLLDVYSVHFLLAPYYSGLIAHKPNGALATFHVGFPLGLNSWDHLGRLVIHNPLLGIPGFAALWICYFAATVGLIAISLRLSRLQARESPEQAA